LPTLDASDDSAASVGDVTCAAGEVTNYNVTGGGHTWRAVSNTCENSFVGSVNRDFNASEAIVEFFKRH